MTEARDWIDLLERREREAEAGEALAAARSLVAHPSRTLAAVRRAAGLTREELAARMGASPAEVALLEDPDQDSHSLSMLRRAAEALGSELRIDFVPRR